MKEELERIRPSLPEGVDVVVGYDESLFISQSIYEVEHALFIALASVIGVIFLFLRSVRATIIPALAIPVSIIASFIAMAAFGFSINVLTLLGLVLAMGALSIAKKGLARWSGIVGIVGGLIAILPSGVRRGLTGEEGMSTAFGGKLLFLAAVACLIASILGTIKPETTKA